jgi:hypothetical protein
VTSVYRHIGLCLETRKDEGVDHKWNSGFISFLRLNHQELAVPPLIENKLARKVFGRWFKKHSPDLIIAHDETITT